MTVLKSFVYEVCLITNKINYNALSCKYQSFDTTHDCFKRRSMTRNELNELQCIIMGMFDLTYDFVKIRSKSRNELNSYIEATVPKSMLANFKVIP